MKNQPTTKAFKVRMNRVQVFLITLLAWGMISKNANAQLYTRTTFNAGYVPITTVGGATVSTATGNDVNQTAIPLGFTLNYAGVNYTTVGLNTNGLLFFDAVAPNAGEGAYNNNMYVTGAGGTDNSISAWWTDMADDASSEILYQTQGTVGSQTFTVQYTNYPHYTGVAGTNIRLNFQVIFYEGTNVIEFHYGSKAVTGPPTISGGACIGIEYGTGGAGNFIDLVTGSSQTAHGMLSPLLAWPSYNYRLTPGAPTPVASGTYNVGIGQTYPSLTLATSDLNHRGISGPVTLNLTDVNYDTSAANGSNIFPVFVGPFKGSNAANTVTISKSGAPATLSYRGSPVVQGGFGCGGTGGLSAFSDSQEPIMGVSSRYTTISNINLVSLGTTANDVEIGLMVFESYGGDSGAQHNLFDKISVNMDRTNANTIGILSNNITNPGGIQGSNSFNTYRDITIRDCYAGIYLQGAGGVYEPDAGNQIISSSCTTFNSIGDPAVPNDIGGGSATYGIWLGAQNTFILRNTIIRNISTTSAASTIDGILVQSAKGVCEISNCSIRTIKRNNTAAGGTYILTGIRLSHANSVNEFRIFNNSISELSTNYSGVATASRAVRGIYFDDTGSGTNTFNIWNNSISIDGSTFPNASNTCIQFADGGAFTVNMKNNVLANFTSAQTGVARHYCIVTSEVDKYGLISSLSDYNDLFIANDQGASGHIGLGATTNYSTLAAWQAGMSFNVGTDANSVSANPEFANNTNDLHGTALSLSLDGTGTTPPAFITTDFDCQTRIAPHDIGFDDFSTAVYTYYLDGDNDSYGNALNFITSSSATPPAGYSADSTDCNDGANGINPGATEITCNGIDENCNGMADDGTSSVAPTNATSNALFNSICLGNNVTLTVNGGSLGAGATWQWYEGGCGTGASIATGNSAIITPLTAGTHTYFVRAEGGCGNTTCVSIVILVGTAPPAGTIHVTSSPSDGCVGNTAPFSVNTVATAQWYHFTGTNVLFDGNPSPYDSPTPSVTVTFAALPPAGNSGWSICVSPGNACGSSNTVCSWVRATLNTPSAINGSIIGCASSTGNPYSINAVSGAAAYVWSSSSPEMTVNGSGQNVTVDFTAAFVSATLCVHAQMSCGSTSNDRCITIRTAPVSPGTMSGPSYVCPNASASFSINAVPGALSYTWSTTVPGASISPAGTTASILFPTSIPAGSTVCVSAVSSCGNASPLRCKGIATGMPNIPGSISGPASGQCGASGVSYSVNPVSLATGYLWTASNGATFSGPVNLSSASVNFPASFTTSTLTVKATNNCGQSPARTLVVSGVPTTPPAISGNTSVCNGSMETYSTIGSTGATAYAWTTPAGSSIVGPVNGSSILVQWGAAGGTITCKASNTCGLSGTRTLAVAVTCREANVQNSTGGFNAEVYPNPATEKVNVKFNATSPSYRLMLTDMLGQNVLTTSGIATEGINMIEINTSTVAKGIYQLSILNGENTEQVRLIVE